MLKVSRQRFPPKKYKTPDKDGLIIFVVDFRELISIGKFSKRKNLVPSQVSSFPIVYNSKQINFSRAKITTFTHNFPIEESIEELQSTFSV